MPTDPRSTQTKDRRADPPIIQLEHRFAYDVSRATGIDPRVIFAWEQAEGAYAPGGTGGLNFLNLRPYKGDPYVSVSPGGFEQFSNLWDAEAATVKRLRQPFASGIINVAKEAPRQQIGAIAASGWDAGHYGGPGGPNLLRLYGDLFGGDTADQPSIYIDRSTGRPFSRQDADTNVGFLEGWIVPVAAVAGLIGLVRSGVVGKVGRGAAKGAGKAATGAGKAVAGSSVGQKAIGAGIVAGIFSALGVGPFQLAEILAGAVLFLVGLLVLGRTVTR